MYEGQYFPQNTSFFEQQFVPLALAFIALVFLAPMIDVLVQWLENVMRKIPKLPDQFEPAGAYFITVAVAYIICWQGEFDFFAYVNLNFDPWQGYLLTAMILSGGTKWVRSNFELANSIPAMLTGGLMSTMYKIVTRKASDKDAEHNQVR